MTFWFAHESWTLLEVHTVLFGWENLLKVHLGALILIVLCRGNARDTIARNPIACKITCPRYCMLIYCRGNHAHVPHTEILDLFSRLWLVADTLICIARWKSHMRFDSLILIEGIWWISSNISILLWCTPQPSFKIQSLRDVTLMPALILQCSDDATREIAWKFNLPLHIRFKIPICSSAGGTQVPICDMVDELCSKRLPDTISHCTMSHLV